jgi:transcriptional regulator GlxA family with amidase domain
MNHHPKNIAILIFAGGQSMNTCGAAAVFAAANDVLETTAYSVHILSPHGGAVATMSPITILSDPVASMAPETFDTVLLSGGGSDEVRDAFELDDVRQWVMQAASRSRRIASTSFPCTLALGRLGLLDGRRITTHWAVAPMLAQCCPQASVHPGVLYVEDGGIWTGAGATSAIDMSIDMVSRDLGSYVANQIAKRLVLTGQRPGDSAQVSTALAVQEKLDPDFSALIMWMRAHLPEPLDVATLAAQAAMSVRHFQRSFRARTGHSPARFLERLRLEHGHALLATGLPLKRIATQCGYASAQQFAKAFARRFGMQPSQCQRTTAPACASA